MVMTAAMAHSSMVIAKRMMSGLLMLVLLFAQQILKAPQHVENSVGLVVVMCCIAERIKHIRFDIGCFQLLHCAVHRNAVIFKPFVLSLRLFK